tara:strand:+ start:16067 stop:16774 length:708 start_codon:yes stop_codon:yes gene_type:complete
MQKERILIVEDEEHIAEGLRINLSLQGFDVKVAIDGAKGLSAWREFKPHLLVVDLMMPVMDGSQLVSHIRAEDTKVPILILTAKDASQDKVKLLQKGVDDYLTKPFVLDEFLLRVARLIEKSRWYRGTEGEVVIFGNDGENQVDFSSRAAVHRGEKFDLTEQELEIFRFFFENADRPVERAEVQEKVLGFGEDVTSRTLDNFIVRLRRYFEDDPKNPQYFESVRGVGYRFHLKTR